MADTPTRGASGAEERFRWLFAYAIDGDLRFISHHDTLRMFQRALIRAELPLRWSEGFNPHPRMTIPLPRPVGIASDAECIVVDTQSVLDPDAALARLAQHTPPGMVLKNVRRLAPGERLQPDLVRYRMEIAPLSPEELATRILELREATSLPIERTDPKTRSARTLDLRPYLVAIEPVGTDVEFTLKVTGAGAAKPAEIAALLGFDPAAINHRIRRLEIQWQ